MKGETFDEILDTTKYPLVIRLLYAGMCISGDDDDGVDDSKKGLSFFSFAIHSHKQKIKSWLSLSLLCTIQYYHVISLGRVKAIVL